MEINKLAMYMNLLTVPAVVDDINLKTLLVKLIETELKKEENNG